MRPKPGYMPQIQPFTCRSFGAWATVTPDTIDMALLTELVCGALSRSRHQPRRSAGTDALLPCPPMKQGWRRMPRANIKSYQL
jgi:hypothetical protein